MRCGRPVCVRVLLAHKDEALLAGPSTEASCPVFDGQGNNGPGRASVFTKTGENHTVTTFKSAARIIARLLVWP